MNSTRPRLVALSLVFVATVVGPVRVARADEHSAADLAQARDLLNQGIELREKGDASAAVEKLRAAHAVVRTPITGLELGRAYLLLGKLVEARESFLSVGLLAIAPEETKRSAAAREESAKFAAQLRPRIPTLTIKVTGVPVDTIAVTIDGSVIQREAFAAQRFVNPGSHTVVAKSTEGGHAETTVDLREGEAREVELKIVLASNRQTSGAPEPAPRATGEVADPFAGESHPPTAPSRVLEWSLIGGGAAVGVGGAILMGIEASNAKDAGDRNDRASYDSSSTIWTAGLVSSLVGAAAVATGGILFFTAGAKSSAGTTTASIWLSPMPGGARIGGTWQ
jgi:hypothetical protein